VGQIGRRDFLRLGGAGTVLLATAGTGLLAGCDPLPLQPVDANGLRLNPAFSSRTIGTTGTTVTGTDYTWHASPDGGACFGLPDGGWSYVSNSEAIAGGAGYVRFGSDGTIVDAGRCLSGTVGNCAGGATPWGTWLSCEEYFAGRVWECDPTGARPAVVRPLMGSFQHEAAAADAASGCIYMTEDVRDGALYRFVPTTWGDLSAGVLEVMTEQDGLIGWATVPNPTSWTPVPTRAQVPTAKRFNGGEGAVMSGRRLVFTTKGDNRVWRYDPATNELTVLYDPLVQVNGVLSGVDNVEASSEGVLYVAEDGGDMQIVLVREDGATFPVVQLVGVTGSEMTGPAFDPSGTRLYFSSQRQPGRTYEISGPWSVFTKPGHWRDG
jgi:secreted PhoX family phosphatase